MKGTGSERTAGREEPKETVSGDLTIRETAKMKMIIKINISLICCLKICLYCNSGTIEYTQQITITHSPVLAGFLVSYQTFLWHSLGGFENMRTFVMD